MIQYLEEKGRGFLKFGSISPLSFFKGDTQYSFSEAYGKIRDGLDKTCRDLKLPDSYFKFLIGLIDLVTETSVNGLKKQNIPNLYYVQPNPLYDKFPIGRYTLKYSDELVLHAKKIMTGDIYAITIKYGEVISAMFMLFNFASDSKLEFPLDEKNPIWDFKIDEDRISAKKGKGAPPSLYGLFKELEHVKKNTLSKNIVWKIISKVATETTQTIPNFVYAHEEIQSSIVNTEVFEIIKRVGNSLSSINKIIREGVETNKNLYKDLTEHKYNKLFTDELKEKEKNKLLDEFLIEYYDKRFTQRVAQLGQDIANDEARNIFLKNYKNKKSLAGFFIYPLQRTLVEELNSRKDLKGALIDLIRMSTISQVHLWFNLDIDKIAFEIRHYDEANFNFAISNKVSIDNPTRGNLAFSMEVDELDLNSPIE